MEPHKKKPQDVRSGLLKVVEWTAYINMFLNEATQKEITRR
jgi:hypothetical protein